MEPLPSHRQLITALITSVSDIAPSSTSADALSPSQPPPPAQASTSPLQSIPPSQRPLLLTLHVLFPNNLLPALDLLDRGLVTRLVRSANTGQDEPVNLGEVRSQDLGASHGVKDDVFLVRSLATTLSRRTRDFSLSSKGYMVHLNAWNCSCASFTLDAFPSRPIPATEQTQRPHPRDGEWSFGGVSLDARGDAPPCCKHLLACLLVDKWPGLLGRYAEERIVSRDEMAGIVAEV
ncbi:hypothetical protein NM208_g13622 [Fusarium decemcellulare]|uniref:Uncharacterized protein n=1 Tax=Fusarium decemcellulare TaxID=57161 RepID=A0ACC1RKB7_9HYPO|nr:hypothetical protein NM208_g13622 [Fusarium decemcellulare]